MLRIVQMGVLYGHRGFWSKTARGEDALFFKAYICKWESNRCRHGEKLTASRLAGNECNGSLSRVVERQLQR